MKRQPVVAGRFYESDPARLDDVVDGYLSLGELKEEQKTLLAMVPHAGYIFSGAVCGKTLAMANLEETVLLLGPNHTGRGELFSLWPGGEWDIPGGPVKVDEELVEALVNANANIKLDTAAHVGEHSLEVILPFLRRLNPATTVVPLSVSMPDPHILEEVGRSIGKALKALSRPVSIVVSSDMSHYISSDEAKRLDSLALEAVVNLDPASLYETVRGKDISMCGVLPMTAALYAALELGATNAELTAYTNSGEVSGDFDKVVGYAGVLVR